MAADIGRIAQLLDATLDHKQHRKAEQALHEEEKKVNYSLTLLNIVASTALPEKTRLAAALAFKNFLRSHYVDEEGKYKLPLDEVQTIKQELVGLMISSPPRIQTQLGEAISTIADSDFWKRWDTLVQDLVKRISPTDYKVTNGVLEVAHSIFKRWRPLFQSNGLYEEINHVLGIFGEPFVRLLGVADQQIEANSGNPEALKGWFETLSLLVQIFYDLSCQDLPPILESNLQNIAGLLQKYLAYTNPTFAGDDDEASTLEIVKGEICEALTLYTTKFDEDFRPYTEQFITAVWNLLSTTGLEKRNDLLVSKALQFLTAVASQQHHAQVFADEGVQAQIIEKVVLPNVALRESDIEMFEDEPIEFIRRDLEGSDTDSRRHAATSFLRKLLDNFGTRSTQLALKYINHYLEQGKSDWKAKDTAVYLFLAIAAKGTVTAAQGVKSVNPDVDVVSFFQNHVAADLVAEGGVEPILKVDAIKFLHNFRSQLSKSDWQQAFGPLVKNMASDNYVVYTYAAIAVERLLFLTSDTGEHLFTRVDIEPFAKDLLDHLFSLIEKDPSPAKLQENEFLMRCVMRVLIVMKDGVVPLTNNVLDHLIQITNIIKTNPSNPRFIYYHFEAIGALVRYCGAAIASKIEGRLWEPFSSILNEDITEFIPYIFQIFSALLEVDNALPLPHNFKTLIKPLLAPTIWETRGNVPGCARFFAAIIPKAVDDIVAENQLEPILGIFQKLVSSKKTEPSAFDILESIVSSFTATVLDKYFGTILQILFTKLQSNPSETYKQRFVRFYHLVSARGAELGFGADYFIKHAEALQSGVFTPIYLNIILQTTGQFARPVDRKTGVISYTKTLCDSTAFAQRYQKGWGFTCNHLLDLLKNPPKVSSGAGDEIVTEADVDDVGFGVGFTALNTCKRGPRDDFPQITNVQSWVGDFMKQANQRHGGAILGFVNERLTPESQAALAPYLQ